MDQGRKCLISAGGENIGGMSLLLGSAFSVNKLEHETFEYHVVYAGELKRDGLAVNNVPRPQLFSETLTLTATSQRKMAALSFQAARAGDWYGRRQTPRTGGEFALRLELRQTYD